MVTLGDGGRIDQAAVDHEIIRLRASWRLAGSDELASILGAERAAALDRFDRVQLTDVVAVCRTAASLSAAGRVLFASSRQDKRTQNDADRLRKYLARFDLTFEALRT